MAYDAELADRVRECLAGERGFTEKRMFGGLAFLLHGNMSVAASGQGGLLVRVDPSDGEALIRDGSAEPMEMRGKEMSGWLRVSPEAVRSDQDLIAWVVRGTSYARTLPPKT